MNLQLYTYDELTKQQLYDILRLRSEVFVVEQKAPYQDMDDFDHLAHHVCVYESQQLIAYARVLPAHTNFEEVSLGRFIITLSHRGKGLGHKLLSFTLQQAHKLYGNTSIRIMAQSYIQSFYAQAGFEFVRGPFIYEDLPHIEMLRKAT